MIATIARWSLIFEVFAAPFLLGGARPWALALLAIPVAIALLVHMIQALKNGHDVSPVPFHALRPFALAFIVAAGWLVFQSLPVWPKIITAPFDGDGIALAPAHLPDTLLYLLWLAGIPLLCAWQQDPIANITPFCKALVASAVLQAMIAHITALTGIPTTLWFIKTAHMGDFTGTFANRNAFCAFVTTGFFACLYLWQHPPGNIGEKIDRYGGWLAIAIVLFATALGSHSRAGIVALMAGTFIFMLAAAKKPDDTDPCRRYLLATGILLPMLASLLLAPDMLTRFVELARPDWLQRDDVWQSALAAIIQRPLTGYGPNGIAPALQFAATPGMNDTVRWVSSHNLWLDMALTLGLPVFIIVMMLLITGGAGLIRRASAQASPPKQGLFLAFLTAFLVQSCFDGVTGQPAVILPLLMIAGCLAALPGAATARQKRAKVKSTAPQQH
ncbi:O-antigen ligase [Thalassospira sp. TSL5-1]|uniref:O-antigen ligase family protein n=1 Tax=Thalassospira sp. TSL5-1 TaxID=1544451 RepID=UPI00093E249B|nr:O-antigen ligase family protein [Thalassospira sp. TSL5-1]OKH89073.1 hypothetical protein LF95_03180 [Thalassospira sp. TSL5-1]